MRVKIEQPRMQSAIKRPLQAFCIRNQAGAAGCSAGFFEHQNFFIAENILVPFGDTLHKRLQIFIIINGNAVLKVFDRAGCV
jgi:hypothetical protein